MKINNALILGIPLAVTIISGVLLSSSYASADDVVDEVSITVPESCSLSGTGMDTHNANIANGTINSAIGETTIKAMCNDNEGFAIYAIGYTNDEDGKNVLTNFTLGSTYDITTGTATNSNTSNWAMKLTATTSPTPTYPIIIAGSTDDTDREQGDPDYTTFQEVPDDYTLVAKRKSGTDIGASAEGASLKTTYQVYISPTQPAGTYTGQVKYTMVHPHSAAAPVKPISIETAMKNANKQKLNGYYKMQDVDNTICSTVNVLEADSIAELIDTRDNQVYKVAKLKDGKCWMVENLNIAGGTALSSTDTDFEASYTLPTTNGWTVADGKLILPASAIKNENDNNLTDSTQFSVYDYAYVFNSGNLEDCGRNNHIPCYSYYSWDTATVGSGRLIEADNTDASYSICPKGWKLPSTGGDSNDEWKRGDLYVLATAYGIDLEEYPWSRDTGTLISWDEPAIPPDFLISNSYISGEFYSGNFYYDTGYYWSSTSHSSDTSYNLYLGYSGFSVDGSPNNYYQNRKNGYSVRCLFGS
ncbi:hypothetical protein IKG49_02340 [Candidatus Saccharibacteria bacterium]|nr:hypothetical protein [Candidatus Saccharibacteria bacterium]